MRRNEKTLNFKKEISGRDWVLTRVFRLSILKSGEKVRGRLVDVPCLLVGGRRYGNSNVRRYMYKIGIVLFGMAVLTLILTLTLTGPWIECLFSCLFGRGIYLEREGGTYREARREVT